MWKLFRHLRSWAARHPVWAISLGILLLIIGFSLLSHFYDELAYARQWASPWEWEHFDWVWHIAHASVVCAIVLAIGIWRGRAGLGLHRIALALIWLPLVCTVGMMLMSWLWLSLDWTGWEARNLDTWRALMLRFDWSEWAVDYPSQWRALMLTNIGEMTVSLLAGLLVGWALAAGLLRRRRKLGRQYHTASDVRSSGGWWRRNRVPVALYVLLVCAVGSAVWGWLDYEQVVRRKKLAMELAGPLREAVEQSDAVEVARLLAAGADPNVSGWRGYGRLPLYHAIAHGDLPMVQQLLSAGADPNCADTSADFDGEILLRDGYTEGLTLPNFLFSAIKYNQPEILQLLIRNGADVHRTDSQGRTPLHIAVGYSDRSMKLLLAAGADVAAVDREGNTPLHETEVLRKAELLVSKGADVSARNRLGQTPLHRMAGAWAGPDAMAFLVNRGASVKAVDARGRTPLHYATEHDYSSRTTLDRLKLLIDSGADVKAVDSEGNTPLHGVISDEIAALLISKGANVNARNALEQTPFLCVAGQQPLIRPVLQLLLDHGASADVVDAQGRTPLHMAAKQDLSWSAKFLLDSGADAKVVDSQGNTTLHGVISAETVRLIVAKGVDVNARNAMGQTPLHCTAATPYQDAIRELVQKGADVNVVDRDGRTPMHWAAWAPDDNSITQLAQEGASVNVIDREGRTPMHWAAMREGAKCIGALLDFGADLDAVDRKGRTPLHWATLRKDAICVEELLYLGADASVKDNSGRTAMDIAKAGGDKGTVRAFILSDPP